MYSVQNLDTRKEFFENWDVNIRTHLRCLIWRAWKRPKTRAREMHKRGLYENIAWKLAYNGRGPWWNARSQHMRICFPNALFVRLGLYSLKLQGIA
ncbi:MAG TPA: transcription elongation factor GreAB [Candidatus Aphodousia faecipullorum]|nr:transcription elongation factor GreAB [Candidatus Aphodousia faecipullorum]